MTQSEWDNHGCRFDSWLSDNRNGGRGKLKLFCSLFFRNGRSISGIGGFSTDGVMLGEGANLHGLAGVTGAGGGGNTICGL